MLQSHLPPVAEPPQGCHVSQPSDLCAVRIEVIKDTSYQLWPNLDSFKSFPPHSAFLRLNINWFKRRLSALYADSPVTTDCWQVDWKESWKPVSCPCESRRELRGGINLEIFWKMPAQWTRKIGHHIILTCQRNATSSPWDCHRRRHQGHRNLEICI